FREKLSHQTGAGSAQRCSDAELLTSGGGPGQEQVDQVHTGDEQDQAHGTQHDAEGGADIVQVVEGQTTQRGERRAHPRVRLGILLRELPADRVEARVRLSDRDARAWAHDAVHSVVAPPGTWGEQSWHPELRPKWKSAPGRHHRDRRIDSYIHPDLLV